jgi:ADP-heptose:LPS heptosyltransferase
MGFGGALIWTGLVRNLKNKYPDKKVIFVYRKSLLNFIFRKRYPDHIIYKNNEDINCAVDDITWHLKKWVFTSDNVIVVDMGNPACCYHEKETKNRIFYKTGGHAIQIACDVYDIPDAELQPKICLTTEEIDNANRLLRAHGLSKNRYICLEPHTKKGFTPNKAWFWENWQNLIELVNKYIADNHLSYKLVQVGVATDKILNGVIDLTGKTSFRETAEILKNSITFIGYMSGLVHLSKAVGKRNIVLISAWEPLELGSYPDDINFYTDIDCKNCGLKVPCPINRKCMEEIAVEQVFEAVKAIFEEILR